MSQELADRIKAVMAEAPAEIHQAFASAPPATDHVMEGLDVQSIIDWLDNFDPNSLSPLLTVLSVVSVVWPPAGAIAAGLTTALPWLTKLLPLIKEALQLFGTPKAAAEFLASVMS